MGNTDIIKVLKQVDNMEQIKEVKQLKKPYTKISV